MVVRRDSSYIPPQHIQSSARALLDRYVQITGFPDPPYDPEAIIWEVLNDLEGLSLNYHDLKSNENGEKIAGKTLPSERLILIDEETRTRPYFPFTVGHEIGHWILHCRNVVELDHQKTLFDLGISPFVTLCRDLESTPKDPLEIQANLFSANLLMPEHVLRKKFTDHFGEPSVVPSVHGHQALREESSRLARGTGLATNTPLWKEFGVSVTSMAIRLEQLGLVQFQEEMALLR